MKSKAFQFLIIFLIHEQPVQAKNAIPHALASPKITHTILSGLDGPGLVHHHVGK